MSDGLEIVIARLAEVVDPELPGITLTQLGVLREVRRAADGVVEVVLAPTFLGCPAFEIMAADVRTVLAECGHPDARVNRQLDPPWSSDWISPAGLQRLRELGIAPPAPRRAGPVALQLGVGVTCPSCGSRAVRSHSAFGPTLCQSMMRCDACAEMFAQFAAV